MAGETEGSGSDNFWSWRDAMYRRALATNPDEFEIIAGCVYSEMLRFGITAVAEFHYMHKDPGGQPYANPGEMSIRLLRAATRVGMGITLIPVYYHRGDFDQEAGPQQRRFLFRDRDEYLRLVTDLQALQQQEYPGQLIGHGIHSLRAAGPDDARELLDPRHSQGPVHLHIAEQEGEVEACRKALGRRPVRWLLDEVGPGPRHFPVHATHMDPGEVRDLALSGATVVLCPSTEGNLGDGFFDLAGWLAAGGRFAIGTDSHAGLFMPGEMRWLDYGQRLLHRRRNILPAGAGTAADQLLDHTLTGGCLALGRPLPAPATPGCPLDGLLVDPDHPLMGSRHGAHRTAAFVYSGTPDMIRGRYAAGRWIPADDPHNDHAKKYRQAFLRLRPA